MFRRERAYHMIEVKYAYHINLSHLKQITSNFFLEYIGMKYILISFLADSLLEYLRIGDENRFL
jgi:hypothetical protein